MAKIYSCRELVRKLRRHDSGFEVYVNQGKRSERMLYHPDVDGAVRSPTL